VIPALHAASERLPDVVSDVLRLVSLPVRPTATMRQVGGAFARIGWFVLVWSIFGTAISRHVALKLVGEDAPGVVGSLWYGTRSWLAAFNSATFVIVGMLAAVHPGGPCSASSCGPDALGLANCAADDLAPGARLRPSFSPFSRSASWPAGR